MGKYQHYVPQLILRRYSDYVRPRIEDYGGDEKLFVKAKKKASNRASINVLDFKDGFANGFSNEKLHRIRCSKTFGIDHMYDAEIEHALDGLENRVTPIIKAIEQDFFDGKSATVIARPQKDLLRKFIFIMAYRNRKFHRRFGSEEHEYDSNDRTELLAYMHDKGFSKPKDVWLRNLRAFIDVDLRQDVEDWEGWLMENAYPGDARWFFKNMTTSYLCFCTPEDAGEEFLLTQNAYGIFEGPCSHLGWTDWHTFAPVNHRLTIISRNQFLGGIPNLPSDMAKVFAAGQREVVQAMTSRYEDPAEAHSWLEDLPVSRPATSYSPVRIVAESLPTSHGFTQEDNFTFSFYQLSSTFVQRVNSIFLQEAIMTDTVIYRSWEAFRKALEAYLENDKVGFKVVWEKPIEGGPEHWFTDHNGMKKVNEAPEHKRLEYLQMLERIARGLGSQCRAKFTMRTLESVMISPPLPPLFIKRYRKLGFDDLVTSWLRDEEQARSIYRFWLMTNEAIRNESRQLRETVHKERLELVSSLHPRRVWLYLRLMRVLTDRPLSVWSASRKAFLPNIVAEDNRGPEDVVVDCMSAFYPHRVSQAMMRASGMRQYYELCTERGHSPSKLEYFNAAMHFVGSIAECDLVRVKEAATEVRSEPDALAVMVVAARSGRDETIGRELWMRDRVQRNLEDIMAGSGLQVEALQELKELLFQLLYPLPMKS